MDMHVIFIPLVYLLLTSKTFVLSMPAGIPSAFRPCASVLVFCSFAIPAYV